MKKEILYDELLEKMPNKYILTIISGKRARELSRGEKVLTKYSQKDTFIKRVFREIDDGKINFTEEEKSGEGSED
jgi:DNA-directed RNA polymerase subunit omega